MKRESSSGYVPALRFGFLTWLYDPLVAATTRERAFKGALIRQARIEAGQRVLDVGSGTGTLATRIARQLPGAKVVGLDGDPAIVERAREKARRAGVAVRFDLGRATELPYPEASFDVVVSSLFFHHLAPEEKRRAGEEILRVLRPGGELHVADWGKPTNPLMAVLFSLVRLLDGFANTRDHACGRLSGILRASGFESVELRGDLSTMLGTMTLLSARKPDGGRAATTAR